MFKYAPKGLVHWPVTLASREEGELVEERAMFLFKIMTRSELSEYTNRKILPIAQSIVDSMRNSKSADEITAVLKRAEEEVREDDELLLERVKGWRDITDADGAPLPFSEDVLRAMLEDPLLYGAIKTGLLNASHGAVAKNSKPGAAG